jgi:hypothetical protein
VPRKGSPCAQVPLPGQLGCWAHGPFLKDFNAATCHCSHCRADRSQPTTTAAGPAQAADSRVCAEGASCNYSSCSGQGSQLQRLADACVEGRAGGMLVAVSGPWRSLGTPAARGARLGLDAAAAMLPPPAVCCGSSRSMSAPCQYPLAAAYSPRGLPPAPCIPLGPSSPPAAPCPAAAPPPQAW